MYMFVYLCLPISIKTYNVIFRNTDRNGEHYTRRDTGEEDWRQDASPGQRCSYIGERMSVDLQHSQLTMIDSDHV